MQTQTGDEMLSFHLYFDIRHNEDGTVFSSTRRQHFTPPLMNEDRKIRSLENIQEPHRESKSKYPVLRRSASTNCATARPIWNRNLPNKASYVTTLDICFGNETYWRNHTANTSRMRFSSVMCWRVHSNAGCRLGENKKTYQQTVTLLVS